MEVSRNSVETGDMEYLITQCGNMDKYEECKYHNYILTFSGYDHNKKELYEIKEFVEYCHKILDQVPRLIYHLEAPSKQPILIALWGQAIIHVKTSHIME